MGPESRGNYLIELGKAHDWRRGAELGVWYGETFFRLLDGLPDLFLIGVDDWRDNPRNIHHKDQTANRKYVIDRSFRDYTDRSVILEMTTDAAAELIHDDTLDFVFIDADHEAAGEDILNWLPKVKGGGFITGHDYDLPSVKKAVTQILGPVECPEYTDFTWSWQKIQQENSTEFFDKLWQQKFYREGQISERLVPEILKYIPAGSIVNDYGAGSGEADFSLFNASNVVNMVDFSAIALSDKIREKLNSKFTFTVAPLDNLPANFPIADWGICIGVLMLLKILELEKVLAEIRRTCRNLFVVVGYAPYFALGRNMTSIRGNRRFWISKLRQYWQDVVAVGAPNPDGREVIICRG